MSNFLVGFEKKTGVQIYWCEKGNETRDESYGFFKGPKSLGVGLYQAPDWFVPSDTCVIDFMTEEINVINEEELKKIQEKTKRNFFIETKRRQINNICESRILEKYSRDDQRNIDRDALPLKALQTIAPSRLKDTEEKILSNHIQMSVDINKELSIARRLKEKLYTLSLEELKSFDVIKNYDS